MASYITRPGDIRLFTQTITPVQVATVVAAEQTFTVNGLSTADSVFISPAPTGNATIAGSARVSASDTLAVTFSNPTAGNLTPDAGVWRILAIRS